MCMGLASHYLVLSYNLEFRAWLYGYSLIVSVLIFYWSG